MSNFKVMKEGRDFSVSKEGAVDEGLEALYRYLAEAKQEQEAADARIRFLLKEIKQLKVLLAESAEQRTCGKRRCSHDGKRQTTMARGSRP